MKILVLSNLYPPDYIGGYEIVCAQAVDALLVRGHEVRVLTSSPRQPVPALPHVRRSLQLSNIYDPYLQHQSSPVSRDLLDSEARLVNAHNVHVMIDAIGDFSPEVVVPFNVLGLGGLGLIACLDYLKVPWIWLLGDNVPVMLCESAMRHIPELAEILDGFEGRYLAVSSRLVEEIRRGGVDLDGRVDVIGNHIVGERPPLRTRFYNGGTLRIASAGTISTVKGVDILIESAAILLNAGYDDFRVDIYGHANDSSFQQMIHKLGVEAHVRLKGPRSHSELIKLHREHDVFAFPTWEREPFGLVPLEAASQGCVPVMSRSCGVGEFLVHGVHCLKAERTPRAFAEVFASVMDGRVDLEPIARRAFAAAWRDFHFDTLAAKLETTMAEVIRKPRPPGGRPDEAYRLALLAEKLTSVLVQERHCA